MENKFEYARELKILTITVLKTLKVEVTYWTNE